MFTNFADNDALPECIKKIAETKEKEKCKVFMSPMVAIPLVCIVAFCLAFEFMNGLHDAANAVATTVATKVLPEIALPWGKRIRREHVAVGLAGIMNCVGAVTGTAVATLVGKGFVDAKIVTPETIIAALVGAIIWDGLTWYFKGLPSSSSHALLFSLLGAGIATAGSSAIVWDGLQKTLGGMVYSPLAGGLGGVVLMGLLYVFVRKASNTTVEWVFSKLQIASCAYMAFSHGRNDGQKTMGIFALALFSAGAIKEFYIPWEVVILCALAIGIGTCCGGWKIINTMGRRIPKNELKPVHGFAAEVAAATVIEVASHFGTPISTTHAVSASIMGVSAIGNGGVHWKVAGQIVLAWCCTVPACFALGFVLKYLMSGLVQTPVLSLPVVVGLTIVTYFALRVARLPQMKALAAEA